MGFALMMMMMMMMMMIMMIMVMMIWMIWMMMMMMMMVVIKVFCFLISHLCSCSGLNDENGLLTYFRVDY